MIAPLLRARDARVDGDLAVLWEGMTLEADGARVGFFGDASPFFRLLMRTAHLVHGTFEVLGKPAETATLTNRVGVATSSNDPDGSFTASEYLALGADLLGVRRSDRTRLTQDALSSLGLQEISKKRVGALSAGERRALAVAGATVGDPPAIALDRIFTAVSDDDAEFLGSVVGKAAVGRKLIFCTEHPRGVGPEADLLAMADHIVAIEAGRVVASGAPPDVLAPSSRYVAYAARATTALAERLAARGLRVTAPPENGGSEAGRLLVELPEGASAKDIVDAALAVDAPLLELVPLGFRVRH